MLETKTGSALLGLAAALMLSAAAHAQETVKIAYIDPLSGGMAAVGDHGVKHYQHMVDRINAAGGVAGGQKLELVAFDNKLNPQESLIQVQKAIDSGIRYVTQGNGSGVAAAIADFVNKHNERNPGKEILYINYAAVDPILTNEKCTFGHFRWDANSDIKMEALTSFMKERPDIKKVYLINQDYSFGQSVRTQARAMLGKKRPDVEIVGDELHPLAKVTDFSPYVAKIKASGADSVITGNWGNDMSLLLKAAADAGLQVNFYTYYAGGAGGPTAIKQANLPDKVYAIVEGHQNMGGEESQAFYTEFAAKYGQGWWYPRVRNAMEMLAKAMNDAGTVEPMAVAKQLEGMKITTYKGGEAFMRADDHQFFQDIYIAAFGPMKDGMKFQEENTGWGWYTVGEVKAENTIVPTTCKMTRPS